MFANASAPTWERYDFTTAAMTWVVTHTLDNPRPAVSIETDSLGTMLSTPEYVSDTVIHIRHSVARTGTVTLTA